ncbi:MAG: ribosome maturation factor RimM [Fidelibacterota bacterium]
MDSKGLLFLGSVVKSHGTKGEILITINNENITFTNDLKSVWLGDNPNHLSSWEIENKRVSGNKVFLKLRNVETPEEAKFLKGLNVYIKATALAEKTVFEAIGFELIDIDTGEAIGEIVDIESGAMQDIIVFDTGEAIRMLPFVQEFVKTIDWTNREVVVKLIEGLV